MPGSAGHRFRAGTSEPPLDWCVALASQVAAVCVKAAPGIPAELQDTIFYPMVSGRPDGTGLGLAITQNIISQHQGLVECESHPGHTVFSLFLPLEQGVHHP